MEEIITRIVFFLQSHSISNDAWHHVVITFEERTGIVQLFLNGTKVDEVYESRKTIPYEYVKVALGNEMEDPYCMLVKNPERLFIGEIGQFFMWDKVLGEDDVKYMYRNIYRQTDFLIRWSDFGLNSAVTEGCNDAISTCKEQLQ